MLLREVRLLLFRSERQSRLFFLRTYCLLFLVPAFVCSIIIGSLEVNIGDFLGSPAQIEELELYLGLAIFVSCYAVLYMLGTRMLAPPWKSITPVPRERLVAVILCAGIAVDMFLYIIFGYGKAGSETNTSLSILSTLMPKDVSLVLLMFLSVNQPHRFWGLIIAFSLFALFLGWTGQFFIIFLISLYLFRNRLHRRKLLVLSILLVGIAAYPAIFSLKLMVRLGEEFSYNLLTIEHLASRLTGYPALVYMQGSAQDFFTSYQEYFSKFFYTVEPILAIIPKSILGVGGNITLEKAIVEYVGGNPSLTQFIWGLPTKLWYYWQVGVLHFFAYCGLNIIVVGGLFVWVRRLRDEFLSFYIFFLVGMYVWSGDISNFFVALMRIVIFFLLYVILDMLLPRPRREVAAIITQPQKSA